MEGGEEWEKGEKKEGRREKRGEGSDGWREGEEMKGGKRKERE